MSSLKNVIIITGSKSSINTINSVVRDMPSARWLYCGKDIPFSLELDKALDPGKKIDIGRNLQETAREFRQEYIDFIGRISLSIADESLIDCWWLSSISEKNPFISNVFLYFCYVKICQRILGRLSHDLIIISESRALSKSLLKNLSSSKNCRVSLADRYGYNAPEKIKAILFSIIKKAWFFGSYGSRVLFARVFKLLVRIYKIHPCDFPGICIHSFTDNRSLTDTKHYQHIYFQGLGPELESTGIPYFYLIDVLPTTSYISVINHLIHYPENCYLLEEFITITDLIKARRFVTGNRKLWNSGLSMGGVQMEQILEGEVERDGTNTRREEAYLRFCAGKRVSSRSIIKTFIYIFENHIWEKMFCRAFRFHSPKTNLVGYAHSIVNIMYTCYTVSNYEENQVPLPDVIAINGIRAKSVLEQSGFLGKQIEIVGALRYQHLEKKKFLKKGERKKIVLVALSAGFNDSLELTHKIFAALGDHEGITIDLKCHPTLPFSIISPHIRSLPCNVRVRVDSIQELLAKSDVLLYSESTVCIEALAVGVPIVNVRSDHRIDVNIFEGIDAVPSVSTSAEINNAIHYVTSDEVLEHFNELQGIVDDFFAPINENFLEAFTGIKVLSRSEK
jgi:hypothetical protein